MYVIKYKTKAICQCQGSHVLFRLLLFIITSKLIFIYLFSLSIYLSKIYQAIKYASKCVPCWNEVVQH